MNIHPFNYDSHYQAMEAIDRKVWPMVFESADVQKHSDSNWDSKYYHRRFLCEIEGQLVGCLDIYEPYWKEAQDLYSININVDPDFENRGVGNALYDKAMRELKPKQPKKFSAVTREDKPQTIRFIEKRRFTLQMRLPASKLDIQAFNSNPFQKKVSTVTKSGINIFSWEALEAGDPDHWEEKIWEMRWPIRQDIPSPDPPKRLSFDEFKKRFTSNDVPDLPKDGCFVAVDGSLKNGNYIGYTFMFNSEVNPTILFTGSTGVLREYRRRGVTTALKVCAIEWAKTNGYEIIETDNEENNPMYGLNIQLGYEPAPAWLVYGKEL